MDRYRARQALERDLARHRAYPTPAPPRGWVRAIRDALGMSTRELAGRMGSAPSWVTQLEQREVDGTLTLSSLRRAAAAMDCRVEYVLVPERPLDEMVREQARHRAADQLAGVDHTMALEDQRTDGAARRREIDERAAQLVDQRGLWTS